jgi:hypothetical protein
VVTLLFAASGWLRYDTPADPPTAALVLSLLAVMLATVTAWLGGELVAKLEPDGRFLVQARLPLPGLQSPGLQSPEQRAPEQQLPASS